MTSFQRVALMGVLLTSALILVNLVALRTKVESLRSNEVTDPFDLTKIIEQVLEEQRNSINVELIGYNFSTTNSTTSLNDLVLERGGRPVRSIIVTSWRSGSTFLGDVLNSAPANYYHCEPLTHQGILQVRGPPLADMSLKYIRQLLMCNYTDMDHYLTYGQKHTWFIANNTRLWNKCLATPQICFDPQFLSKFCSLFPFQSMKLVRMRLSLMEDILADANIGAKILFLVRDPRGTIQSRRRRHFCQESPDCHEPLNLCTDLVADYLAALTFKKKFPNSFRAVRYEDIALDPYNEAKEIFKFLGLQFHPAVRLFLESHTKKDYFGRTSSTYRDSRTAPFHWRTDLSFADIVDIQNKCTTAMSVWGYAKALNSSHAKTFSPVILNHNLEGAYSYVL